MHGRRWETTGGWWETFPRHHHLYHLASRAFVELHGQVTQFIGQGGAHNQPVEFLAEVRGAAGATDLNCVATLRMGQAVLFSTNFCFPNPNAPTSVASRRVGEVLHQRRPALFIAGQIPHLSTEQAKERAQAVKVFGHPPANPRLLQIPENRLSPVPLRHAEMRLLIHWRLTHPEVQDVTLCVDKICCIFCAAQIRALGLGRLIAAKPGENFRNLQWYTFAPLAVFFRQARTQLWGADVETAFVALTSVERRQVLTLIASFAGGAPPPAHTPHPSAESVAKRAKPDPEGKQ